jgi:23S rRNA (uracil1939-C5)-methyltransferase
MGLQEPEILELDLSTVAFGGSALGRADGEVVFVPYALPGERIRARVQRRRSDYATADLVSILSPSPERVAPRCPYFGACGGCQWQHAGYPRQLAMKQEIVADQLRRIGGMADAAELVRPCLGMIEPWEYRNHVRFTLGRKYGELGYTHRGTRRLLPVQRCDIAHPEIGRVLAVLQRRCAGLPAHQVTVRYGCNTGDLLVNPAVPRVEELATGQLSITDEVLDRRFHISAAAFFQVNTLREARSLPPEIGAPWLGQRDGRFSMADLLTLVVLDQLRPGPEDVVVDAYSGVGTFTALMAPWVQQVIGIEESPAAVGDAVRNTADLDNVRFVTAKTEHALGNLGGPKIDAVVLDPSRIGCAPEVIQALLDRRPARVIYVSCDPATLARDLRVLREGGYAIDQVQPLDMFPQTYHIEAVTTLTWNR